MLSLKKAISVFQASKQNDDTLLDEYCRYLKDTDFDLRRLAIISEDETAYGAETRNEKESDPKGPSTPPFPACYTESHGMQERSLRLFYPRGIAAVRTAYQKQSIFSSEGASSSDPTGQRTLSTDIADQEGQQHDTIRSYNTEQLPQSQEAVLQQIASQLRTHQAEYIVLRSSNPIDQLFLAHYLRLAYPHGRIVNQGGDLLLRREHGGGAAQWNHDAHNLSAHAVGAALDARPDQSNNHSQSRVSAGSR